MRTITVVTLQIIVAALVSVAPASAQTIAYDAVVQPGNQDWTGNLGLDFDVNQPITVTSLGVFDNNGDGFSGSVSVAIFNRDTATQVTPTLTFSGTAGTLVRGDRFLPLAAPVTLPPGNYSVVAVGFNSTDLNGNSGCVGNATATCDPNNAFTLSTENGGYGLITFVGSGRFDTNTTLYYPTMIDGGPSNRYLAGTFRFRGIPDALQLSYAANLTSGPSVIDMTNTGSVGGDDVNDLICANVYVFAQDQQLISCCACPLTPNDLQTLNVQSDLINNTLTPGVPTGVTVALVATEDFLGAGPHTCNAAIPDVLVPGLRAWSTTLHATGSGGFAVTEDHFRFATWSASEYAKMTSFCAFIQANGSGFGICNKCTQGAAGAAKH